MLNPTFRNLTDADIQECGELFLKIFGPQGCGEAWTLETSLKTVQENSFNKEYCFVAEVEGKIIGMILAFTAAREANTEIFIDTIGVQSEYQGQHVGKSLLDKVEEVAKKNNVKFVRLLGNPRYLSYDWYQKIGMSPTGWVELMKSV